MRSAMADFNAQSLIMYAVRSKTLPDRLRARSALKVRLTAVVLATVLFAVSGCSGTQSPTESSSTLPSFTRPQPVEPTGPAAKPDPRNGGRPGDKGNAGNSRPPVSAPAARPSNLTPGQATDFDSFHRACEGGVSNWRTGRVNYPSQLRIALNKTAIYSATVDLNDNPLPPDKAIGSHSGEPSSEAIAVKCRLAAKLVAIGDHVKVNGAAETDWVPRQFTPSGVAKWSWPVTVDKPINQQVQFLLLPAVLAEGRVYADEDDRQATVTTDVAVEATLIETVSYWFETQWPLLAGIATVLAVAIAASRRWVLEQVKAYKASRRGRTTRAKASHK